MQQTNYLAQRYCQEAIRQISMLRPSAERDALIRLTEMVLTRDKWTPTARIHFRQLPVGMQPTLHPTSMQARVRTENGERNDGSLVWTDPWCWFWCQICRFKIKGSKPHAGVSLNWCLMALSQPLPKNVYNKHIWWLYKYIHNEINGWFGKRNDMT